MADGKKETIFSKDVVLVMAAAFFFMFSNMYCNRCWLCEEPFASSLRRGHCRDDEHCRDVFAANRG